MERIIFLICLCVAVEAEIGKHVFIPERLTWSEAQAHCQQHYTDLSYFNSQSEMDKLPTVVYQAWIGLHRDPNNQTAWKWSGGHITYQSWANGQPNNQGGNENTAFLLWNGKWHDGKSWSAFSFYCVDVTVEEEKKSWEEVLNHCRDKQTHLVSLLSDTDRLLVQTRIRTVEIREPVWIGLRFLGDRWMWINGDPLEYEAWSRPGGEEDQQCGVLTTDGLMDNWNCQDKLHFICI